MGELWVGLRTLLGAVPVAVTRLGRTAVGSSSGWQWLPPAIPWLIAAATALAVGLLSLTMAETGRDYPTLITLAGALVGGIVLWGIASVLRGGAGLFLRALAALVGAVIGGLVASLLADTIVDAPFAFAVVAGALVGAVVLGWRLQIARSAHEAAKSIGFVPAVIWILLLLAAIPAIQAGAEIIVTRASVPAFVERQVGFSSSLVDIRGLAMLPPYQAEAPLDPETGGPAPGTYRWFPLRDQLNDPRIALVRSQLDGAALERREIVARVDPDIDSDAAVAALRARGIDVPDAVNGPSLQALSDEAAANASGVQSHRLRGCARRVGAGHRGAPDPGLSRGRRGRLRHPRGLRRTTPGRRHRSVAAPGARPGVGRADRGPARLPTHRRADARLRPPDQRRRGSRALPRRTTGAAAAGLGAGAARRDHRPRSGPAGGSAVARTDPLRGPGGAPGAWPLVRLPGLPCHAAGRWPVADRQSPCQRQDRGRRADCRNGVRLRRTAGPVTDRPRRGSGRRWRCPATR